MKKVVSNPDVLHGKPCILGTVVTVSSIMAKLAKGFSIKQIAQQLPQLSEEDVVLAIKYAEQLTAKPFNPVNE